jgi:DNA-binding beta-propeller fold protein YncE
VIATVPVGEDPITVEFNPNNNNIYVANFVSDNISVIGANSITGTKPIADAGPDQSVKSGDIVRLDGSNSSEPAGSELTYSWSQVSGSPVTLSDPSSSNPTFTAPKTNEVENLIFQLVVTNEEGISSEPDEVTITINPSTTPPEKTKTIHDLLRGIIQNPLNVTNYMDSANEIRDILTDNNQNNDQIVCDLVDSENDITSNIQEILNC